MEFPRIHHGYTGTQSPGPLAEDLVYHHLGTLSVPDHWIIVGCCVGMDTIVGMAAHNLGFRVHGVLPANRYKVDQRYLQYCDTIELMPAGTSFMQRNDRIIELAHVLTAFPKTEREELRSGTWATIRRGRKKCIPVDIIPVGGA